MITKKIILISILWSLYAAPKAYSEDQLKEICQKYNNIDISGIYLCKYPTGDSILLQTLSCEDCPNFYYHMDKTPLAACCVAMCSEEPSKSCKELSQWTCDFNTNLYNNLCEKY